MRKLFANYKIQAREPPLGSWLPISGLGSGVLFLAVVITIFMQFRRKIVRIFTSLYCEINYGNLEICSLPNENARAQNPLLIGLIIFVLIGLYFFVASSWFRKISTQIVFPVVGVIAALSLFLHGPIAQVLMDQSLLNSFISWSAVLLFCLFWVFFEVVPRDPILTLKKRWLAYWKFCFWRNEDPTVLRALVLGPLKLVYLDCFAIRCIECGKNYFYKSAIEINPMAEKCENCGFSVQSWAEIEIRDERIRGPKI